MMYISNVYEILVNGSICLLQITFWYYDMCSTGCLLSSVGGMMNESFYMKKLLISCFWRGHYGLSGALLATST